MSIISRNVARLGTKFLENIEYEDIDYRGFTDTLVIEGSSVIVNDMKLWLQSSKGDYYRRYNMGGYFDNNLKNFALNADGALALEQDLMVAIEAEFPSITVLDLQATPSMQRRGWKLRMIVRDQITGVVSPIETGIAA